MCSLAEEDAEDSGIFSNDSLPLGDEENDDGKSESSASDALYDTLPVRVDRVPDSFLPPPLDSEQHETHLLHLDDSVGADDSANIVSPATDRTDAPYADSDVPTAHSTPVNQHEVDVSALALLVNDDNDHVDALVIPAPTFHSPDDVLRQVALHEPAPVSETAYMSPGGDSGWSGAELDLPLHR